MSDKFTAVRIGTGGGLGIWGHTEPAAAIAETRLHYEREAADAIKALAAIDAGDVTVFHQYGPYAMRDRKQVWPPASPASTDEEDQP